MWTFWSVALRHLHGTAHLQFSFPTLPVATEHLPSPCGRLPCCPCFCESGCSGSP